MLNNALANAIETLYMRMAIAHLELSIVLLIADEREEEASRCFVVYMRLVEMYREMYGELGEKEYEELAKFAREAIGRDISEIVEDEMPEEFKKVRCPAVDAIINGALLGALRLK